MTVQDLIIECVIRVLREHAEGRNVGPDRLTWALEMAANNPKRFPKIDGVNT